jgi:hypothetical protein
MILSSLLKGSLVLGLFMVGLSSGDLRAATRTVFFSGSSSIPYLSAGFSDQAKVGYCSVTVVNLSGASQKVEEVSFLVPLMVASSISTQNVSISLPSEQLKVSQSAIDISSSGACIGQELPPNSYCTLMKRVATLPVAGIRNIHCSGKVKVSDWSPAAPGSVVASGSVVTLQESMVLGGVLSGAHYYGSPNDGNSISTLAAKFDGLPGNKPGSVTSLEAGTNGGGTGQMNLSCYANCKFQKNGAGTEAACRNLCGVNDLAAPRVASIDQLIEARPYSAGVVHEVTMGPFMSICSGNSNYHSEGGVEFSHTELTRNGDVSLALSAIDQSGGLPERLYCMHRHANDDLYSRVGATSAFAINGGNPF